MELNPTTVRLPVKQILDTNLAWIRREVEPKSRNDQLLRSMRQYGLKLPILLTNDLTVADGARRIVRANTLGWREVPVIVTSDWSVVQNYYANVQRLEAEGEPALPMTWQELMDLISGPLYTLYEGRRKERWLASRIENKKARARGEEVKANRVTDFLGEVAELLSWPRSDLKGIREALSTIETIATRESALRKLARTPEEAAAVPDNAAVLKQMAQRLEAGGGDEEGGLYTLVRAVRLVASGQDLSTIKTSRAKRNLVESTYRERKEAAVQAQAIEAPTGRELDGATITNFAKVLSNLGTEARAYTHVRPTVVGADAAEAAKDIRVAVTHFNGLARLLKAYAQSLEERT